MIRAGHPISPKGWQLTCFVCALCLSLLSIFLLLSFLKSKPYEEGVYRILASHARGTSLGTGFKISDPGYIVTNYHVIENSRALFVANKNDDTLNGSMARLIWYSADQDLAILKTETSLQGPSLTLADIGKSNLEKASEVIAVGFPGVVDRFANAISPKALDKLNRDNAFMDPTVTKGSIQRLLPSAKRLMIQHSANINSGNSGGPLFDQCGRVIGVNTITLTSSFTAKDLLRAGRNGGRVQVTSPGDIGFSVHIREVVSALRTHEIRYSATGGQCVSGLDQSEMIILGGAITLALASGFVALLLAFNPALFGAVPHPAQQGHGQTINPLDQLLGSGGDMTMDHYVSPAHHPNGTSLSNRMRFTDQTSDMHYDLSAFLSGGPSSLSIGREDTQVDFAINDISISRRHARLDLTGNRVRLRDLSSTNGTLVNGQKVPAEQDTELRSGDIITFGSVALLFEFTRANLTNERTSDAPYSWLLSGFDHKGRLIQHHIPSHSTQQIQMDTDGFTALRYIGRDQENDIILDDDAISRSHAVIGTDQTGQLSIKDLGSSNGTYIDGRSVGPSACSLENINTISFGSIDLTLSKQI
ncbi:MAG: FHA domain-containing protein [Cohaesibacter sp.]|nr:FHA domain-containing protein [Cohaesibacter sp.]